MPIAHSVLFRRDEARIRLPNESFRGRQGEHRAQRRLHQPQGADHTHHSMVVKSDIMHIVNISLCARDF